MKEFDKEVLVFSRQLSRFNYGASHPLKVERLQLTMDLIAAYGLLDPQAIPWVEATEAEEADLLRIHSPEYLEILKKANQGQAPSQAWRFGLGSGDNPVFPGLYDWSLLVTGASLEGGRQITEEGRQIAFNISGGLHHALRSRASGFCYLNDPAVAIARLVEEGLRVAYLDIDVHHGDGVQAAFYQTDRVLTISLHQHGHTLFPGTGFPEELGEGPGRGYSVNIPLAPGTDDDLYHWAFMEVVPPLLEAFKPDLLVSQLGIDTLATDPLASLNLTIDGFCQIVREIKSWGLKWLALGGGGYRLMNVARAWSRAWAIMKGVELPEYLPDLFLQTHQREVAQEALGAEEPYRLQGIAAHQAWRLARAAVEAIKKTVFPIIGA